MFVIRFWGILSLYSDFTGILSLTMIHITKLGFLQGFFEGSLGPEDYQSLHLGFRVFAWGSCLFEVSISNSVC